MRSATRVGPFQFLVQKQSPQSTDTLCPGQPSANDLSVLANPATCSGYVTNKLEMIDNNANMLTVEIVVPPTFTEDPNMDFTPGVFRAYAVYPGQAFNDVPCLLDRSGTLPAGVNFILAGFAYAGTPAPGSAGIYRQAYTWSCGGPSGSVTEFDFNIRVATDLAFTSPTQINATVGVPVNFRITTTGSPKPTLTSTLPLPIGWQFQDNGDGTATISGTTPIQNVNGCLSVGQPCGVTADNGIQQIFTTIGIHLADFPDPLTVVRPADGSTIQFPIGVYSSYTIQTTGGTEGPIHFTRFYNVPLTDGGNLPIPSWMTITDNGDGSATVAGRPPFTAALSTTRFGAVVSWCCGLELNPEWHLSVTNPTPQVTPANGNALVYLAGSPGLLTLTSTMPVRNGTVTALGPLPPGLSLQQNPVNDLCIGDCAQLTDIVGTPPLGSGGTYDVPFRITGPGGTNTQTLRFVIYEKPALVSGNKIVFNAGVAATTGLRFSGYPLAKIGSPSDSAGQSKGLTVTATSTLPSFLKFVNGLDGIPNGSAYISATSASVAGHYTVNLSLVEDAAATPLIPNPKIQLGNTATLDVYVVPAGDVNLDFTVNCNDVAAIKAGLNKVRGSAGFDPALDVVPDGIINVRDLAFVTSKMPAGTTCK